MVDDQYPYSVYGHSVYGHSLFMVMIPAPRGRVLRGLQPRDLTLLKFTIDPPPAH